MARHQHALLPEVDRAEISRRRNAAGEDDRHVVARDDERIVGVIPHQLAGDGDPLVDDVARRDVRSSGRRITGRERSQDAGRKRCQRDGRPGRTPQSLSGAWKTRCERRKKDREYGALTGMYGLGLCAKLKQSERSSERESA